MRWTDRQWDYIERLIRKYDVIYTVKLDNTVIYSGTNWMNCRQALAEARCPENKDKWLTLLKNDVIATRIMIQ